MNHLAGAFHSGRAGFYIFAGGYHVIGGFKQAGLAVWIEAAEQTAQGRFPGGGKGWLCGQGHILSSRVICAA